MTDIYTPKSDFLRVSMERGLYHQSTDLEQLDQQLLSGTLTGYIGFDCTAPSFHIGNLVQILRLYWLQQTGHRPIALMGGGTTMVGDPSGKDATRKMLTIDDIEANKTSLKKTFSRFIDFDGGSTPALMVDNAEWLVELRYLPFLRDVGKHFSVNRMLAFESVSERLKREQEMSFIEFNYMILQAYDFVELRKRYDCTLQLGGSDQWGNIVSGVDLGRRMGYRDLNAMTCELITMADGRKMGKTADGAVWLNEDLLSPYHYWQFWRNTSDADVLRFLRIFTRLPLDEIARLEGIEGAELNDVKVLLANEATTMLHGAQAAAEAEKAAKGFFGSGALSADDMPGITRTRDALSDGALMIDVLVDGKLAGSRKAAKRLLAEGAVSVNSEKREGIDAVLTLDDLNDDQQAIVSRGRKNHILVSVEG